MTVTNLDLGQGDVHTDSAPGAKRSRMKTLEQLKAALEAKEISQEEFDAAKKKLNMDDGGESTEMTIPTSAEMTEGGERCFGETLPLVTEC